MKLKAIYLATVLAFLANSAVAGSFQPLTDTVFGAGDNDVDPFYIKVVSATYESGYGDTTEFAESGLGNVVAKTINYRTFTPDGSDQTLSTGTLTLEAWRVSTGVDLSAGSAQADIYDFVYRDSSDNSLVFGTRYLNRIDNNEEANFIYRYGFTGYSTAVAWTNLTLSDSAAFDAVKTGSNSSATSVLDQDVVRFSSDLSVTEDTPWSGLYLVKTNATSFELGDKAIGYFQSGEESQPKVGGYISGYIPTVTAVPEPESYALMMLGLTTIGLIRRQKKHS